MNATAPMAKNKPQDETEKTGREDVTGDGGKFLTLKVHRPLAKLINDIAALRGESVAVVMDTYEKLFREQLLGEMTKRTAQLKEKPRG